MGVTITYFRQNLYPPLNMNIFSGVFLRLRKFFRDFVALEPLIKMSDVSGLGSGPPHGLSHTSSRCRPRQAKLNCREAKLWLKQLTLNGSCQWHIELVKLQFLASVFFPDSRIPTTEVTGTSVIPRASSPGSQRDRALIVASCGWPMAMALPVFFA